MTTRDQSKYKSSLKHLGRWWKPRSLLQKIAIVFMALVVLLFSGMYGIAQWYIHSRAREPLTYGATFIPSYARYLGVDPQQTMSAAIHDLGIKHFRLVSYWDQIEPQPGYYDFSDLDWQFQMAKETGSTISLAIGLRQPRWPECHMPDWASGESKDMWGGQLLLFMRTVIERYKDNPALQSYQLENEFFIKVFGQCKDFDRGRLINEYKFVKSVDPNHPVIVSRSNNAIGMPIGQPTPDEFGVSIYKRVWDKAVTKRYFEYPFPAWFYGFLAGGGKLLTGKDMIVHELQAEPWLPDKFDIKTAPVSELYKSLNPQRLHDRFEYGKATGMKDIDLWGVEWWYSMKEVRGLPDVWNTAKQEIQQANKN